MSILAAEWSWSYCHNLFIPWVQMNPLWGNWRKLMTLFSVSWVSTAYKWKTQLSHWPTRLDRKVSSCFLPKQTLHFCILCEVVGTKLLKLLIPGISLPSPSIRDKLFRNTKSLDLFFLFCSSLFILMYSHSEQWPVSYYFILTVSICTF